MADRTKTEPMTMAQVQSAIHELVSDAVSYMEAELSPARAQATQYNRGDLFGNEETGRSKIVLTVVRDVVGAVKPSLIRLFLPTSGHVIRYDARPKDDAKIQQAVADAQQATEFINGVTLEQDNNGYTEISNAFEDGLVRKVGFVKYFWEDTSSYQAYTIRNCDVLQYEQLNNDPDVEITKATKHMVAQQVEGAPSADATMQLGPIPMWDVEFKQWRREGVARLICTPPEEVLVSRDARDREDATFFGHRTEKTTSQLIEMGVPAEEIADFGGLSSEVRQSIEEITRRGGIAHSDQAPQPQLKRHLWIEAYPYLDIDGDGMAELVKVNCLGPDCHVVGEPEPIAERPFALFCPFPQPHVLFGESLADRVMDLQLMESSVLRAAADGLSMSIFPRRYYTEGAVDKQAMDSTAISQDVPVYDGMQPQQAVMVEHFEWKGQDALALLQYLDQVKTNRIGPLPATLDPDSLQSTPQLGVKAVVQAASEQTELIARNFATGMKQLARGLLRLVVENQPRQRIVRLRDTYVPVDPRAWDAEMDVSIQVALGTQEKLGVLAANTAKQEMILQTLGPTNPAVTIGQLVHSYRTMLQMAGVSDVGSYWQAVDPKWQPPPQPPSPDPNMVLAQAETVKAQAALAKAEADFTLKQAQQAQDNAATMTDAQFRAAEIALKREQIHLEDERERDKAEADVAVKIAVANAQFGSQITVAQIDADIQREQMATDAVVALKPKPVPEPPSNGNTPDEVPA